MTGAFELKGGLLLDAPHPAELGHRGGHELTIGCAGGVDVTATGHYTERGRTGGRKGFRYR
jgi:dipeptidase D